MTPISIMEIVQSILRKYADTKISFMDKLKIGEEVQRACYEQYRIKRIEEVKECEMFSGEGSEQYNALMTALTKAARAEDHKDNANVYDFLQVTPKTSLVVELVDALHDLGYKIIKS